MVEQLSIKDLPVELKVELLKELEFDSDGTYVIKEGKKYLDKYTEEPIKLSNMLILPGSTIILDNNPLSITLYMEEFGEGIFG